MFDADGRLINSSERWPVPDVNISDRAFFRAFKANSTAMPVLIELLHGRFIGELDNRVRARRPRPDGEFLGVVTRAIDAGELREILRFSGARGRRRDLDVSTATERCWRATRISRR